MYGEVPLVRTLSEGGEGAGGGGPGRGEGVPKLGHGSCGVAGRDDDDLLGLIVEERLGLTNVGGEDGCVGRFHVRHDLGEGGAAVVTEGPGYGADVRHVVVVGDGGARLLLRGGGDASRRVARLGGGGAALGGIPGVGGCGGGGGGGRVTSARTGVRRVVADDGHVGDEFARKYLYGKLGLDGLGCLFSL